MWLVNNIRDVYSYLTRNIAFFPTVIGAWFLGLAVLIAYLDTGGLGDTLNRWIDLLIVEDPDTARAILGALIGGLISLTVFSFSMVMIVLNRAAGTFSPRVIPGLISHRSNQFIIGFYLGSIIFSIITLISVQPDDDGGVQGTGVLLAVLFGIGSLGLFVYLIHSISNSIQVSEILKTVYGTTLNQLQGQPPRIEPEVSLPGVESWAVMMSDRSGYFQEIKRRKIVKLLQGLDLVIEIVPVLGSYVTEGTPMYRASRKLEDKDHKSIMKCLSFYEAEHPDVNYLHGLKQIAEIGAKALSSALNDPGTAMQAVDFLTHLLYARMSRVDTEYMMDDKQSPRVVLNWPSFPDNVYGYLSTFRAYAQTSLMVYQRLLEVLRVLVFLDKEKRFHTDLCKQAAIIAADAGRVIENHYDRGRLNQTIEGINAIVRDGQLRIETLDT